MRRVTAVVLAAGSSRRYGENKLLVRQGGRPLAQHALDAAERSMADEIVLVVGHAADDVLAGVAPGRARVVVNPDHASGQASSLRAGIAAAGGDAVVVLLADQPHVTAALVDALVARQRETGAAAVVSSQGGRRSPPTLLHRDLWPAVDALRGDVGAREILAGRDDVVELEVPPALGRLDDVDRPDDLREEPRGQG